MNMYQCQKEIVKISEINILEAITEEYGKENVLKSFQEKKDLIAPKLEKGLCSNYVISKAYKTNLESRTKIKAIGSEWKKRTLIERLRFPI